MPLPGKSKTAPVAAVEAAPSEAESAMQAAAAAEVEPAVQPAAYQNVGEVVEKDAAEVMPFDADADYADTAKPAAAPPIPEAVKKEVVAASSLPDVELPADANVSVVSKDSQTSGELMGNLANQGYEGVGITYGTFPQIALQNTGKFESSEGWEMGEEFKALLMGAKIKWIVKNTKCEKRDEDLVFSYDKVTDVNQKPVAETIAHWAEQGWGFEYKEYREVPAEVVGGDWDGEMVILSIPSTSIRRLNRHLIRSARKGVDLAEIPTQVAVGAQITNVDYPFFPWDFREVK
jgi:hypothetical protein